MKNIHDVEVIPLAITRRTAQMLMQFIGETVQKIRDGIWNTEDTPPFIELAMYFEALGIFWTDEGSDVYWWSTARDHEMFYDSMRNEGEDPPVDSPIFLSEEKAEEWVKAIEPNTRLWMWAHWGRGHMGPGREWDPQVHQIIPVAKEEISESQGEVGSGDNQVSEH